MARKKWRSWMGFWRAAWRLSSVRCSRLFCAAGAVEGFSCDKVEEAISNMRTRRRDELRCGRMRKGFNSELFMKVPPANDRNGRTARNNQFASLQAVI